MRQNKRIITAAVLAIVLLLSGLTACESAGFSEAEKLWKAAGKESSFEKYIAGHASSIDTEALKAEAASAESTLSQQFKATALLCAMEYLKSEGAADWKDHMLYADYPQTTAYAQAFLDKINTQGDEFWASLEDAFYPYDCFLPIFAAAGELDGQTFGRLWKEVPEDSSYADAWTKIVDQWVQANPGRLTSFGEGLVESGYYDDWDLTKWRATYLHESSRPDAVRTATVDEALGYIDSVRNIVLDSQEKKYGDDHFKEESQILGELCYATGLTVTIDEELALQSSGQGQEAPVETEGKKVAAFYRNPKSDRYEGSPAALRLLGDFMLQLSEAERPSSLAEADYFLVLTAQFEYGNYYQSTGGSDTKVREVNSDTSVDLYDAKDGTLIRHLGTMQELAPDSIVANYGEESLRYPEEPAPDVLLYIYRHINEPETYRVLADKTAGRTERSPGEPVIIGSWEITYHESEIVSEFDAEPFHFEADNGCEFVRSSLTITNIGFESEEFISRIGGLMGSREVYVQLLDLEREETYEPYDMITNHRCLNGSYLDPQETKEGELIFEIPESVAERAEDLCLAVSFGTRVAYYSLQ